MSIMKFDFAGQVTIITGAAGNLGAAVARAFSGAGAKLALIDRATERFPTLFPDFAQSPDCFLAPPTDGADLGAVSLAVDKIKQRFGRIDILINNAAIFATIPMNRGGIDSIDPVEWDRMMAVNLKGLFFCCRAVLPAMRQQKSGKIVNISSGTALNGSAGRIHYVTSKAGVIGFTRTLAREVGDDNINVNAIAPGSTLSEDNPSEEILKMRGARVGDRCLKRVQLPKDLVGTVLFLSSPLSDFMTGQTVSVDGGTAFL